MGLRKHTLGTGIGRGNQRPRRTLLALLAAGMAGLLGGGWASASVIAFDDAFQGGCTGFATAPDTVTVVDSPFPRYAGDQALKLDAGGAWHQLGVDLNGMKIPADATTMQFDICLASPVTGFAAGIVQLGGPTWQEQWFNGGSNTSCWTIDGKSLSDGASLSLTPDTWHTMTMDLPTAYGDKVVPGTTTLLHVVAMSSQSGTLYLDNVQLASVPEPVSMALLGLGAAMLLRRRQDR